MENLAQAALGVLTGKCEPKSVVSKKIVECEPQSENIEGDKSCTAEEPVIVEVAEDRFESTTAPAVKEIKKTIAAAKKELVEEKGWLDTVLTSFQNLPTEAKSQLVAAGKNLVASVKCIGDSCTLVITQVAEKIEAIAPGVAKVAETATNFLSSIGTSIGDFLPGYSSLSSIWNRACEFGKSIWHSCTSYFERFLCDEKKEQERQKEDEIFYAQQDRQREETKKIAQKTAENKKNEQVAQAKRVLKAKEIERDAIENKRTMQLIEVHPTAIAMDDLETRLIAVYNSYNQALVDLASSTDTNHAAEIVLSTIAMMNSLSNELNHKQKVYETQSDRFKKTTESLSKLRYLV